MLHKRVRSVRFIYWEEVLMPIDGDTTEGIPIGTVGVVDTNWNDGWIGVKFESKIISSFREIAIDWLAVPLDAFEVIK